MWLLYYLLTLSNFLHLLLYIWIIILYPFCIPFTFALKFLLHNIIVKYIVILYITVTYILFLKSVWGIQKKYTIMHCLLQLLHNYHYQCCVYIQITIWDHLLSTWIFLLKQVCYQKFSQILFIWKCLYFYFIFKS